MYVAVNDKFPGLRVLVAEDFLVNQEVIHDLLTRMECEVKIAEDGHEAITFSQQQHYDIAFLDIQMPEHDGYDVAKAMRKMAKYKETPIVAVTANAQADDEKKCSKAGMDGYISKPIKGEHLAAVLKKFFPEKHVE